MPTAVAERRMAEIEAALPDVRFAWNGRVDGSRSIYYRIQGPNLIIEFSTEGSVGASGGHYHSIYRTLLYLHRGPGPRRRCRRLRHAQTPVGPTGERTERALLVAFEAVHGALAGGAVPANVRCPL